LNLVPFTVAMTSQQGTTKDRILEIKFQFGCRFSVAVTCWTRST